MIFLFLFLSFFGFGAYQRDESAPRASCALILGSHTRKVFFAVPLDRGISSESIRIIRAHWQSLFMHSFLSPLKELNIANILLPFLDFFPGSG